MEELYCKVYPLALTKPDWGIFIQACQDEFDFTPTRGLDRKNIDTKSAQAFPAALDLRNEPNKALLDPQNLKHFYLSFMVVVDEKLFGEVLTICSLTPLHVTMRQPPGKKQAFFITGSAYDWQWSLITLCSPATEYYVRYLGNQFYTFLCGAGFSSIWDGFKKSASGNKNDDTFILEA